MEQLQQTVDLLSLIKETVSVWKIKVGHPGSTELIERWRFKEDEHRNIEIYPLVTF